MQDHPRRQLAAIMFMDIQGYTSLLQHSEAKALSFIGTHKKRVEHYSQIHNGEVVSYYGDASLTKFNSAVEAVNCAVELQREFWNKYQLPMRIGIHLGEIVHENETIYGNGVNVASRIESMGIAGSVLISGAINTELENQDQINTQFIGKYKFKNVAKAVNVYAIHHDELVLPTKNDLVSEKSRETKMFSFENTVGSIILAILLAFLVYKNVYKKINPSLVLEERLAVPSFKNFTGENTFDYIGDMVAHRITKELFEINSANVVDFQTKNEISQIQFMSIGEHEMNYLKEAGAVNIIEGSVQKVSKDTLMFSVLIKRLETGEIIKSFPNIQFSKDDPISGMSEISDYIHGYWQAKDQKLLSFPKLEAYKLYIKAKNNWYGEDDVTEKYLLNAIEIDPEFYDLYDLLLTHYYNTNAKDKALPIIESLAEKKEVMTYRQRNMLELNSAYFNGDNFKVYTHSKAELANNPRDLFINTGFMVISSEFVHNNEETLKAFDQIDIHQLNISECGYCEERLRFAVVAALALKSYRKAKRLVKLFPKGFKNMRSNVTQLRYLAIMEEYDLIEDMVNEVIRKNILQDSPIIRYYAARELFSAGRITQSKKYASEHIQAFPDQNDIYKEWSYFFLDSLEEAKASLNARLKSTPLSISEIGLLGVIEAKLNNN